MLIDLLKRQNIGILGENYSYGEYVVDLDYDLGEITSIAIKDYDKNNMLMAISQYQSTGRGKTPSTHTPTPIAPNLYNALSSIRGIPSHINKPLTNTFTININYTAHEITSISCTEQDKNSQSAVIATQKSTNFNKNIQQKCNM